VPEDKSAMAKDSHYFDNGIQEGKMIATTGARNDRPAISMGSTRHE